MEEQSPTPQTSSQASSQTWSIQDYLALGYLYLIVLGILSDSIFYRFLGINILNYTSFLDIIISPISALTGKMLMLIAILLIVGLCYGMLAFSRYRHLKNRHKESYQQKYDMEKLDKINRPENMRRAFLIILTIATLSFYGGAGVGKGYRYNELLKKGELECRHYLFFNKTDSLKVRLIGQNSLYIFYAEEGKKSVSISPVQGVIQRIVPIEEKDGDREDETEEE